ncbi:MAG: zf-HC2 domain-containing protein [Magnetococcales bacterium]|nr:zf-HC2 domain-containing protein [Magnetococcales bacterium]MBF0156106.1 zf-HC2 domain-containing protein [Magnetococcales bacterium]
MACDPELVSAFLDGELDAIIVGRVTDHLLECEECYRAMTRLAWVRDIMVDGRVLDDPAGLTRSVMAAISNEKVEPRAGFVRRLFSSDKWVLFLPLLPVGLGG